MAVFVVHADFYSRERKKTNKSVSNLTYPLSGVASHVSLS